MSDDVDRKTILDRANRMLRQSRTLRRLSDELHQESNDLRSSVKSPKTKRTNSRKKR